MDIFTASNNIYDICNIQTRDSGYNYNLKMVSAKRYAGYAMCTSGVSNNQRCVVNN